MGKKSELSLPAYDPPTTESRRSRQGSTCAPRVVFRAPRKTPKTIRRSRTKFTWNNLSGSADPKPKTVKCGCAGSLLVVGGASATTRGARVVPSLLSQCCLVAISLTRENRSPMESAALTRSSIVILLTLSISARREVSAHALRRCCFRFGHRILKLLLQWGCGKPRKHLANAPKGSGEVGHGVSGKRFIHVYCCLLFSRLAFSNALYSDSAWLYILAARI